MFKLIILCVLLTIVTAAPGYLGGGGGFGHSSLYVSAPATTVLHEPTIAKVGALVKTFPSAVSHSSVTQVHSGTQLVQPLLAPAIKTTVAVSPSYVYHAAPLVAPAALHFAALSSPGLALGGHGGYGHW